MKIFKAEQINTYYDARETLPKIFDTEYFKTRSGAEDYRDDKDSKVVKVKITEIEVK